MSTEEKIVDLLCQRGLKIATAESCTGGMIAAKLVSVAGVSEVFEEGYITYANRAKEELLGVRRETLERYGAVSEETAREMAEGAARKANADCSVVSTGIAGPGGGTAEKPVGLVFIGVRVWEKTVVRRFFFEGSRAQVRRQAAQTALAFLYEQLTEQKER